MVQIIIQSECDIVSVRKKILIIPVVNVLLYLHVYESRNKYVETC